MDNCVSCNKNIGTIMSYEGGLVYCDQCANICNNCNMWLAVCGEKDGIKLYCDGCWEELIYMRPMCDISFYIHSKYHQPAAFPNLYV